MTGPRAVLPAEPLLERVRTRGGFRACTTPDEALERAYSRALASGQLTPAAADRLAVRVLGEHPAMVWGDDWWEDVEEPVPFLPVAELTERSERQTNCRPGRGPCRRRHHHASVRRAA
jgi:hypothetical protein